MLATKPIIPPSSYTRLFRSGLLASELALVSQIKIGVMLVKRLLNYYSELDGFTPI